MLVFIHIVFHVVQTFLLCKCYATCLCVYVCTRGHAQGSSFFKFVNVHYKYCMAFSVFLCPTRRFCTSFSHCCLLVGFVFIIWLSYEWITCDRQPNDVIPFRITLDRFSVQCNEMDRFHCSHNTNNNEWY